MAKKNKVIASPEKVSDYLIKQSGMCPVNIITWVHAFWKKGKALCMN